MEQQSRFFSLPTKGRIILWSVLALVAGGAVFLKGCLYQPQANIVSEFLDELQIDTIYSGASIPWALDFLPDGSMLFTDRDTGRIGRIRISAEANAEGEFLDGDVQYIAGVPAVDSKGQGGLLDVLVDPGFAENRQIYFSASIAVNGGQTTQVFRAVLEADRLENLQILFSAQPAGTGTRHYGSRLAIDSAGFLFISVGDRGVRHEAQNLSAHMGKIIRLHTDGRVPEDNPFVENPDALPEIWSYGHRNPQGLAIDYQSGELWSHEHGPRGGDEVNRIQPRVNYGWPVITYGIEYTGGAVGDGIQEREGMVQPGYYYVPSIAPSDMVFYQGDKFPEWGGHLLIGAMKLTHLQRLKFESNQVADEFRMLGDRGWRFRSVAVGPDGYIYVGVDGQGILRIKP